jgi:hypothetical protein
MRPVDNPIWTALYRDLKLKDDSFTRRIVMEFMAEKPQNITPNEALLKEAQALEKVAQAHERLAVLYGQIARGLGGVPLSRTPKAPAENSVNLANLPLIDAILEFLKTCKGPKTGGQIWAALEKAGCEVASDTPERSVQWALKKAARTNPDLIAVGWGQWDLKSKYSKAKLERILKERAGRGGRTAEEHKRRTRAGMEKARERGEQIGATSKMTPEVMDAIEAMIRDQKKVADIAAEVGVSKASIYGRFTVGRVNGMQTVVRRDTAGSTPLRLVK